MPSLLCPLCHTINHDAERNEGRLLAFNVDMYGYDAVYEALAVVQSHLSLPLDMDIPEEQTHE